MRVAGKFPSTRRRCIFSQNKMSVTTSSNNNAGNNSRLRRKKPKTIMVSAQKERNMSIKKVSTILQKDETKRTIEEKELLLNYSEIVNEASSRILRRQKLKERLQEIEDSETVIDAKCKQLAEAISNAQCLVVYTGAGISTAAQIPDYRGTSGIWTLLQQGKDIGSHDLTQAEPTYTHMALSKLYSLGKLKHVVSQNCDGLHLRSGLPKKALSEVHGNMYIEVCRSCRPIREYLRLFDVTENTARYYHKTFRRCYKCNSSLVDSIVHFGERGNLPWPLNWKGACKAAETADMILCIGSSLKVLKRYPWLWCMDKPAKRRPQLYIVNLQWTPKDCQAVIKINGKCDDVMKRIMKCMSIPVPEYTRRLDPIFDHATPLCKEEQHTTNRPILNIVKKEEEAEAETKDEISIKEEDVKREPIESATGESEIIVDTGQIATTTNPVKEELILITIKPDDGLVNCCDLFKGNQVHDKHCANFIDEKNDIPIIMEDDEIFTRNEDNLMTRTIENEVVSFNNLAGNFPFNNFDPSQLLPRYRSPALLTNFCNIMPMYNTMNLLPDISNLILMNNTLDSNLQIPNLGFVIPLLQNFKLENLEQSMNTCQNQSIKRLCDPSNTSTPQKKLKTTEVRSFIAGRSSPTVVEEKISRRREVSDLSTNISRSKLSDDVTSDTAQCSFCSEQYLSVSCLFYARGEPAFKSDVQICECCSPEEDEEAEGEEEETKSSDEKSTDTQKTVMNPGWFGKGCKKNIRKKRTKVTSKAGATLGNLSRSLKGVKK